jgi:hypothetical protein
MALCGLAGMLFYLLLPLMTVISDKVPMTFWQALKYESGDAVRRHKIIFYSIRM